MRTLQKTYIPLAAVFSLLLCFQNISHAQPAAPVAPAAPTAPVASGACGAAHSYAFPVSAHPASEDDAVRFRSLLTSVDASGEVVIDFAPGNYFFKTSVSVQPDGVPPFNTTALIENFPCGIRLLGANPGTTNPPATDGPVGVIEGTNKDYYPETRPSAPITMVYFSNLTTDGFTFFNNTNVAIMNIGIDYVDGASTRRVVSYAYAHVTATHENTENEQLSTFDVQLNPGSPPITVGSSTTLTPRFSMAIQPMIMGTHTESGYRYYDYSVFSLPLNVNPQAGACTYSSSGTLTASVPWATPIPCASSAGGGLCYRLTPQCMPQLGSRQI